MKNIFKSDVTNERYVVMVIPWQLYRTIGPLPRLPLASAKAKPRGYLDASIKKDLFKTKTAKSKGIFSFKY